MSKFKKILTGAALMGSIAVAHGQQALKRITDNATHTIVDIFAVRNGTTPTNVIGSGGIDVGASSATGYVDFYTSDGSQSFSALSSTNSGSPTIPNEVIGNGTFETLLSGAGTRITRENNEGFGTYFDVAVPTVTTNRDEISDGNTNIDVLHFQASLPKTLTDGITPIPTGTWALVQSRIAKDLATGSNMPGARTIGFQFNGTTRVQQANNRLGQPFNVLQDADLPAETPPIMNDISNQTGTVGQAFNLDVSTSVTLTNSDPIISYAIASGSLPAGLILNTSTGVISGTPTTANTYNITITATDNDGVSNADAIQFTIGPAQVAPIMSNVPDQTYTNGVAISNIDISTYVNLTNGDPILSYNLSGTLPTGLSFNSSTGILSGTPSQNGIFNLSITATDNDGISNSDNFSITVNAPEVAPIMNNIPDQTGTVGQAFNLDVSTSVTLTNGDAISSYNIASGTLPTGLTLTSSTGIISGTPTVAGTYNITITATDNDGTSNADAVQFTISAAEVAPIINDIPNQTGTVSQAFNLDVSPYVTATNSDPIISYAIASGSLPAGLTLNTSTGMISGTPSVAGTYSVEITATDNDGVSNTDEVRFTIAPEQVVPIMGDIPNQEGLVGQAFNLDVSTFVTLTNGDPIISYVIASGSLPAGLTLNTSTGMISGTPSVAGTYNITITATDNDGASNADAIQFVIDDDSGIEEINTLNINIYPNPTTEYLSITTPDNVPTVSYKIYDINNNIVVGNSDYSNGDHIDVSRFESGVYIIQCTDNSNSQHTAIQRFIKN